ncbi:recombinase [Rodentibacter genomosp. 2]|uniref:Recombinase n=2 Tax=Rodentibacter genomosp. 2 TaxID=1908266 RepID=A0A1V3JGN7_9PAST|nr:recombinase [Rodentibacter genomosp. 2]
MRTAWDNDFPDTIIDRKLGEATSHPLYLSAKSGNVKDAYALAKDLVTDEAIEKLKAIVNGREAIIVPVHAEEAVGRNMIPLATATVIAKKLGLDVDLSIVQATKVSRTAGDGWHRLIYSPAFDGHFPAGKLAIILDDTQTQGGTLASLKGYIEQQSGKVIAAYALTGKQYSVQLRLSNDTLTRLRENYGSIEQWWTKQFGYDFSKLTEWEARFILNSRKNADEVRNTIVARQQE